MRINICAAMTDSQWVMTDGMTWTALHSHGATQMRPDEKKTVSHNYPPIRPSLMVSLSPSWHQHLMNYRPLWCATCSYKESYQNKPTVNPQSHSCHRFKYCISFWWQRSVQLWRVADGLITDITSLRVIMTRARGVISANCLLHVVTMTREETFYCRQMINWELYHVMLIVAASSNIFIVSASGRWVTNPWVCLTLRLRINISTFRYIISSAQIEFTTKLLADWPKLTTSLLRNI